MELSSMRDGQHVPHARRARWRSAVRRLGLPTPPPALRPSTEGPPLPAGPPRSPPRARCAPAASAPGSTW
eukprot:15475658-Alexandrium_andersonii.AAC.1